MSQTQTSGKTHTLVPPLLSLAFISHTSPCWAFPKSAAKTSFFLGWCEISASLWPPQPLQLEINSHPQLQNAAPVLKLAPQWQAVLHPGDTTCTKSQLLLRKKGIETCHKLLVSPVINDGKWMSTKILNCLQPQVLGFWGSSFHSHDTNQEPMPSTLPHSGRS